jgi:hypothetical protein
MSTKLAIKCIYDDTERKPWTIFEIMRDNVEAESGRLL